MLSRRFAAALLFPLVVGLSACANNTQSGAAPAASTSATASTPVAVSPSASGTPVTQLPSVGSEPSHGANQSITGKVVEGVEANCLLLQDPAGPHLLIFHDPALRASAVVGGEITVVGYARPAMMSNCQQGTPFIVSAITKK